MSHMPKLFVAGIVLLFILNVINWNQVNASGRLGHGVCTRRASHMRYHTVTYSTRARIYTECGFLDSARCEKWTYRITTRTASEIVYRTEEFCCSGFRRTRDEHCEPICNPPCSYGGTCVNPNICSCPEGSTGRYCQIAVCRFGCANGGRCTAPNRCTCTPGWTGPTCETFIEVDEVFRLRGVTYASGSTILWSDIGEGDTNALQCTTTHTNCCGTDTNGQPDDNVNNHRGQYYYADGTPVPIRYYADDDGLFQGRGYQQITLQRLSSAPSLPPSGWYRCDIPDRYNHSHNIYINIVKELPNLPLLSSSNDIAKFQIIVSGVNDCQGWKADTNSTIVRYKSKTIIEKAQELSQVNTTFNQFVDVSLECGISP